MLGTTKRERRLRANKHSEKNIHRKIRFIISCPFCQDSLDMISKSFLYQTAKPGTKYHRCVKCHEWFEVI